MRHGGQRSRRFMRRLEERMAEQKLIAMGREAQRRKEVFDVDMTRPQPCVKYMQQHFDEGKSLYLVGRCLAQVDQERKECLEALTDCFGDKSGAREHLAEELTDVVTAATTALRMLGYDEEARGKLQAQVNEKNRKRGYW